MLLLLVFLLFCQIAFIWSFFFFSILSLHEQHVPFYSSFLPFFQFAIFVLIVSYFFLFLLCSPFFFLRSFYLLSPPSLSSFLFFFHILAGGVHSLHLLYFPQCFSFMLLPNLLLFLHFFASFLFLVFAGEVPLQL
jgi:hypothetical protein